MNFWLVMTITVLRLDGLCDLFCQIVEQGAHFRIILFGLVDFVTGMHNRRMVSTTEMAADFFETVFGQVPG